MRVRQIEANVVRASRVKVGLAVPANSQRNLIRGYGYVEAQQAAENSSCGYEGVARLRGDEPPGALLFVGREQGFEMLAVFTA